MNEIQVALSGRSGEMMPCEHSYLRAVSAKCELIAAGLPAPDRPFIESESAPR